MNNILMVLTSNDRLGERNEKTGFWLEEFAAPYYALKDMGAHITLASPLGGHAPLDPKSHTPDARTQSSKRFFEDSDTQTALADTLPLSEMNAADFDALFYPGGHGLLWDLVDNPVSMALIEAFIQADKPCAFVGHASAVLHGIRREDGEFWVRDRQVTGLSNSEEDALQLGDVIPFRVEDMLKGQGANYQKGEDNQSFTRTDGNLVTGQNPASSTAVAKALLKVLTN